jgi:uncharacterized protein (DUF2141 family)
MKLLRHSWPVLAGMVCLPTWGAGQSLVVTMAGIQHSKGQIHVGLYSDPKTFRKEAQAHANIAVVAVVGETTVRFDDLPPGRYAIMAYHDEDGNGELNRRLGMFPTEGYGLSNNPSASVGPPAFGDSAFDLPTKDGALRIDIRS